MRLTVAALAPRRTTVAGSATALRVKRAIAAMENFILLVWSGGCTGKVVIVEFVEALIRLGWSIEVGASLPYIE